MRVCLSGRRREALWRHWKWASAAVGDYDGLVLQVSLALLVETCDMSIK